MHRFFKAVSSKINRQERRSFPSDRNWPWDESLLDPNHQLTKKYTVSGKRGYTVYYT